MRPWARVPFDKASREQWRDLPFNDDEYRLRLERVLAAAAVVGCDAVLVHGSGMDSATIRYLSGFPNPYMGDAVLLLPVDGEPLLATDGVAHGEPMHTEVYQTWIADVRCAPNARGALSYGETGGLPRHLLDGLRERGLGAGRIAATGRYRQGLLDELQGELKALHFRNFDQEMASLRAVKSDAELAVMREAAEIADAALLAAIDAVRPGVSEREVAQALLGEMMLRGADGPLYSVQVVSGPRSGFRNVPPSDRVVQDGDAVYIGFGLRRKGYCGRAGTGLAAGRPSEEYRRLLEANAAMVESAVRDAGPGTPAAELARTVERVAAEHGFEEWYWGAGHGIGVHTHDLPVFAPLSDDVLQPGMTFVFEPMLCRTAVGTANAERVHWVTDDGVESLSSVPLRVWEDGPC